MEKSRYVGSQLQISRIFSGFFFFNSFEPFGYPCSYPCGDNRGVITGQGQPSFALRTCYEVWSKGQAHQGVLMYLCAVITH